MLKHLQSSQSGYADLCVLCRWLLPPSAPSNYCRYNSHKLCGSAFRNELERVSHLFNFRKSLIERRDAEDESIQEFGEKCQSICRARRVATPTFAPFAGGFCHPLRPPTIAGIILLNSAALRSETNLRKLKNNVKPHNYKGKNNDYY